LQTLSPLPCCLGLQVNPDEESLARLKALKGDGDAVPARAPPSLPVRTAQDELRELEERERAQQGQQAAEGAAAAGGAVAGAGADREAGGTGQPAEQQQEEAEEEEGEDGEEGGGQPGVDPTANMSARQKKLYELQQRMRQVGCLKGGQAASVTLWPAGIPWSVVQGVGATEGPPPTVVGWGMLCCPWSECCRGAALPCAAIAS